MKKATHMHRMHREKSKGQESAQFAVGISCLVSFHKVCKLQGPQVFKTFGFISIVKVVNGWLQWPCSTALRSDWEGF